MITQEKKTVLKTGLKLKQLANEAGITPEYLSRILRGKESASAERAQILANLANEMTRRKGYFVASDFREEEG